MDAVNPTLASVEFSRKKVAMVNGVDSNGTSISSTYTRNNPGFVPVNRPSRAVVPLHSPDSIA